MGLRLSVKRALGIPQANWNDSHVNGFPDFDFELEQESGMDDIECNYEHVESDNDSDLEMFSSMWCKNRPADSFNSDCGSNGQIMGGQCIPEEILSLILSQVEEKPLLNCRLVCQRWRNIIDSDIWRFKIEKTVYRNLQCLVQDKAIMFPVLYKVCKNKPFNKNLIKNSSGEEELDHWRILRNGGDGWTVESPPSGANALPDEELCSSTSCFATSFDQCAKEQIIDLWAEGLSPIIMDELRPTIYVSEWYAARFDCACTYAIHVVLLNKRHKKLEVYSETKSVEQWQGSEWHKVEHEFKNYPKGVRYIKFLHTGFDNQFWKGHYGSKMSRACIKIVM